MKPILSRRKMAMRDRLVLGHLDLVERIARKLHATLPPCFDLADLKQEGMLGLLESATAFDPVLHPGVPFGAFARRRIKGAIQESIGLRNTDPRDGDERVTRKRRWEEATRPPIAEYDQRVHEDNTERFESRRRETPDLAMSAEARTHRREQDDLFDRLIQALPDPRQALVIELHYRGAGVDLRHIAHSKGMPVGAARVSQIRADAVRVMQSHVRLTGLKAA